MVEAESSSKGLKKDHPIWRCLPIAVPVNWGREARVWSACRVNGVRGGEEGMFMERALWSGTEKQHEER